MFVLLYRVCTHVMLGILETGVVLEGMYTCKTGNFYNEPFCLCFFCCIWYALGAWLGSVVGLVLGFNESD